MKNNTNPFKEEYIFRLLSIPFHFRFFLQKKKKTLKRYRTKKTETRAAAPGRRHRASAGDQGAQNARKLQGKAAMPCKKKLKPE